jgi:hypothetical protein
MLGIVSSTFPLVDLDLFHLHFQSGHLRAQRSAFLDQGLFLGSIFLLGNELRDFILPLLKSLCLLHQPLPLIVELNDTIHVGLHVAVAAIGFDSVEVITNVACIQHDSSLLQTTFPFASIKQGSHDHIVR